MRTVIVAVVLAAGVLHAQTPVVPAASTLPTSSKPAVVVLLMVDQFRTDYIARYGSRWTGGLRRLVDTGAYFRQAAYPYAATETCPGHATVATGSLPTTHGIVANGWYDRATKKPVVCTTDTTQSVAIGGSGYESHGARNLRVTTLADELRAQQPGGAKVVSLSLKARSSVAMAGHGGDVVAWLEDAGGWATSTTYTKTAPVAAASFVKAHPVDADYDRVWNLLRPASTYQFVDEGIAEQAPDGWTIKFPHSLSRPAGPDRIFYDNWRRTPFGDEYLGKMAAELAKPMGKGAGTDFLAISFSGLDYIGHRFGPNSLEVQDALARLDLTIGQLLTSLDASIGRGRYVVALTGDHGVAPLPEQQTAVGLDAGRIAAGDIQAAVDAPLTAALGAGSHFMPGSTDAGNNTTDLYFTPEVLAAFASQPALKRAVTDAAERVPGIARALWAADLARIDDADTRALRASFNADRSGDLLLISKPYWVGSSGGTGHGTSFAYDQRVPIIFMGTGIRAGRYAMSATPADIAPTLAHLAGVTLPHADGRVLGEAIVR
ncbi:MAG: alkaline phosphatase family protein [Acidobacteria bacterium]|nr:alkaline phosphatase family protein [Acidobacteriota bacterium]